jgi:hypothetical protein
MKSQFSIEWKARDFKKSHAWIHDSIAGDESPLCEPTRLMPYINPARFVGIGTKCANCLSRIGKIKEKFPKIQVMYT